MQLEEVAQLEGLLRPHDLAQTEDDGKVGDESSNDGGGCRERCLALDIMCVVVGQGREGDVGEQEICDGSHAEGQTRPESERRAEEGKEVVDDVGDYIQPSHQLFFC